MTGPGAGRCFQARRRSPHFCLFRSASEGRALPCPGITRLPQYYGPLRVPTEPPSLLRALEQLSARNGAPRLALTDVPACPAHAPCAPEPVRMWVSSRPVLPSPYFGWLGVHDCTFETCSGFTDVIARSFPWPPQVAIVTRLRPGPARRRPKPLVSYQTCRQIFGWVLHPQVICAVGA